MGETTGKRAAAAAVLAPAPRITPAPNAAGRIPFVEMLRVISCFFVIANHTVTVGIKNTQPSPTWFCSVIWLFFSKTAVPVFIMITGAMLLKKADVPRRAFRRFLRMLVVFVLTLAVYHIYSACMYGYPAGFDLFLRGFFSGEQFANIDWYFHLYLALLCILPLLQKMAAALNKKEILWLLFVSLGVVGGTQLYNAVTPWRLGALSPDGLLSPYIGMLFAGYYLEKYTTPTQRGFFAAGGIFALLVAAQTLGSWWLYCTEPEKYMAFDLRTGPLIVGSAICLWVMVRYLFATIPFPQWTYRVTCALGRLTFAAYLVSDLVISQTRPLFTLLDARLPLFVALLGWEVIAFAVSVAIAALLRAVPFLRKWL